MTLVGTSSFEVGEGTTELTRVEVTGDGVTEGVVVRVGRVFDMNWACLILVWESLER